MTDEDFTAALVRAMAKRCGLEDPAAFADRMTVPTMPTSEPCPGPRGASCVDGRIEGGVGCRSNGMPCDLCNGTGFVLAHPSVKGTGRTTRMLLRALVALEVGCLVEVVCSSQGHAESLSMKIAAMSFASMVLLRGLALSWPGRDSPSDVRLVDHAVIEVAQ